MVQVAGLFNQLLQHFPRIEFAALVKKHSAERDAKGFTCWTQFVSMLFCQLGRADSLREICNGLGCCLGRLVHVGIARAPCRSTLPYANEHRPAALFEDLFVTSLARFRDQQGLGTAIGRGSASAQESGVTCSAGLAGFGCSGWSTVTSLAGFAGSNRPRGSRKMTGAAFKYA